MAADESQNFQESNDGSKVGNLPSVSGGVKLRRPVTWLP